MKIRNEISVTNEQWDLIIVALVDKFDDNITTEIKAFFFYW